MSPPMEAKALEAFRALPGPVYAVLDAARDPRVLSLLKRAGAPYRSLYEGPEAEELASVAPYLVELTKEEALLERLIGTGWGRSWGIFLTGASPFDAVRRHLRRFLKVQEESTGKRLYFRFYDPRVLRTFLPTCTPQQQAELYAEVDCFFTEAEDGGLLRFARPPSASRAAP
ncbi:DUF4123 domain-containing protein [Corallococcus sp. CA053C]|uniref:DUF4123 domain-containing protein n=1 Tax=Corallococcus sp. CA053C TaxID=2316732 RepID=UPI000EA36F6A|nr:DUF4123 domain-containing protein [Corallococcus sp. CA053C]RKH11637.1 DUF4123 domain-containing protein [Corallococcus sp. CA053C]